MRGLFAVALLWGCMLGCASGDPCAEFSGSCVSVEVVGIGATKLDQLRVRSTALGLDRLDPSSPKKPPVTTPIYFALLPATTDPFDLEVDGLFDGIVFGTGGRTLRVDPGKHVTAEVTLNPIGGLDLAGVDFTALDFALSPGADLAIPPGADLSHLDFATRTSVDMSCAPTPDEDGDGIGDACDACPIDAGQLDSDADGVADYCDPDVNKSGNKILMFDALLGESRWVPGGTFSLSGLEVNTTGRVEETDQRETLSGDFQIELKLVIVSNGDEADAGIFVSDQAGAAASGLRCLIRHSKMSGLDTVAFDQIADGAVTDPASQFARFSNVDHTILRLTKRADHWTCTAIVGTDTPVPIGRVITLATPTLQMQATEIDVQFQSIILESIVP